jgi:hypothetical protein
MFRSLLRQLPLVGSLVVGATLGLGGMTAWAQMVPGDCSSIQFDLANPSPGARVDPGKYVVQGMALDTQAEDGSGIDRVDFFLGSREQGGMILGHAVPGIGPFGATSFETTITLPNQTGGQELFGYAHSAVSGQESVISFPIAVGVDPNKAGPLMSQPIMSDCMPTFESAPAPAPADESPVVNEEPYIAAPEAQVEAPAADMPTLDEQAPSSKMFLDVGNPSSGDSIHVGAYMIEGIAFDRAADQSPGIDHIDIFLDNRDTGGTLIGHGMLGAANPTPDDPDLSGSGWTAQVMLTSKMTGQHWMTFYALSGATGEEMVVSIPVRIVP